VPVGLADLRGKVVAVTFIYTECPDICPLLTQKMLQVQDELRTEFGKTIAFFRSASTRSTTRRRS
jgi:protein SCO1/2